MTRNAESFGRVLYPHEAQEPILSPAVRSALLNWLEELWAEEALRQVNIDPRRRALFYGPPGTGKTTLAHHLAARLGMPLLIVESQQVVSKYVGETEKNIGALFRAAQKTGPYALFIDEFDTLAQKRMKVSSSAAHGHNAAVNVLLQQIERYDGILVAATNRTDHLDPAIWRRFQLQIEIGDPGQAERELIIERYLLPFVSDPESLVTLAGDMGGASPSLIRDFCEDLKRQLVIGPMVGLKMDWQNVLARLIASVTPHPDSAQPLLWKDAARSRTAKTFKWPLIAAAHQEENT